MIRIVIASVVLFGVLTAIYLGLDWYMRWTRAKELEEEHAERGETGVTREDYVDRGLYQYERSPERKLLYLVFVLPLVVIGLLAFFIQ